MGVKDFAAEFDQPLFFYEAQSLAAIWKTPTAKFYFNEVAIESTDFPFHDHGILCCKTGIAKEIASLYNTIKILPIDIESFDYSLVNIVDPIDVLNESQCEFRYFKHGPVEKIFKYSFSEISSKQSLFKLQHLTRTDIYCTNHFYDLVHQRGWNGLRFVEVFPNDERSEWDKGLK